MTWHINTTQTLKEINRFCTAVFIFFQTNTIMTQSDKTKSTRVYIVFVSPKHSLTLIPIVVNSLTQLSTTNPKWTRTKYCHVCMVVKILRYWIHILRLIFFYCILACANMSYDTRYISWYDSSNKINDTRYVSMYLSRWLCFDSFDSEGIHATLIRLLMISILFFFCIFRTSITWTVLRICTSFIRLNR